MGMTAYHLQGPLQESMRELTVEQRLISDVMRLIQHRTEYRELSSCHLGGFESALFFVSWCKSYLWDGELESLTCKRSDDRLAFRDPRPCKTER